MKCLRFLLNASVQASRKVLLLSKVCRLGQQMVWLHLRALTESYSRQKQRRLHSTCYLWESAALPSPSSFPASPGSTEITFQSRSAHARLSMKLEIPERARLDLQLSSLTVQVSPVQWKSSCQCSLSPS